MQHALLSYRTSNARACSVSRENMLMLVIEKCDEESMWGVRLPTLLDIIYIDDGQAWCAWYDDCGYSDRLPASLQCAARALQCLSYFDIAYLFSKCHDLFYYHRAPAGRNRIIRASDGLPEMPDAAATACAKRAHLVTPRFIAPFIKMAGLISFAFTYRARYFQFLDFVAWCNSAILKCHGTFSYDMLLSAFSHAFLYAFRPLYILLHYFSWRYLSSFSHASRWYCWISYTVVTGPAINTFDWFSQNAFFAAARCMHSSDTGFAYFSFCCSIPCPQPLIIALFLYSDKMRCYFCEIGIGDDDGL